MNQHSRASSHASRLRPSIDKRVEALEQMLKEVLENSSQLKRLNELHETMPEINQTEKSLRQLQKDIEACGKQMAQVQTLNQKQVLNTEANSTSRAIKLSSKSISEVKQLIREMNSQIPQLRKSRNLTESKELLQCKSNIQPLLQRNKKEVTSILKQFQEDCLLLEVNGVSKQIEMKIRDIVNSKKSGWNLQLKKLNLELGAIKCQTEFIKDRTKKTRVSVKLNEILLQCPAIKDKNLALAVSEEAVELAELEQMLDNSVPLISKQLQQVEAQLSGLGAALGQSVLQDDKQHFRRQMLYLSDRWFNLKNKLHAFKKKYLLKMREIEERYISMREANTTHLKGRMDGFSQIMDRLNQRVEEAIDQFNKREQHIGREQNKLRRVQF